MKVIILAGGKGSRLGPVTEYIPKPMVRVGQYPLLWHIMSIYAKYGHKDFLVALGYQGDVIKDYFLNYKTKTSDCFVNLSTNDVTLRSGNRKPEDWNVGLIDTGLDSLKGARIKRLEDYIDGTTMMTYGDGVADIDIDDLLAFHKSHGKCLTLTGVHPPSRFGELAVSGDRLMNFEEKPQTSTGVINGGYMVFEPELLNHLTTDEDCDLEYGALGKLALEGEVMVYHHKGLWACVDHERDLDYLNVLWANDKAFWK